MANNTDGVCWEKETVRKQNKHEAVENCGNKGRKRTVSVQKSHLSPQCGFRSTEEKEEVAGGRQ